jgi:hypothetical protein
MEHDMARRSIATAARLKWLVWMFASVTLASSAPDEQTVLRRLVGDGSLGPAQIGPAEEIEIHLTQWSPTIERNLMFDLRPDRMLTAARFRSPLENAFGDGGSSQIERVDQVRLSPAAFADVRRRLAIFRPETLGTEGTLVLPNGCHYVFDAGEKVSISFADRNNQFGEFVRQGESECNHSNADRLDDVLRQILALLPRTEAATGFIW